MRKTSLILSVAAIVLILDLLSKIAIRSGLELKESIPLIPKILHLTHVQNTGAGFSILTGYNYLLIAVYIIALAVIFYSWKSIPEKKWPMLFMGLLLGGIVGNLVDRIFFGYVTDFIDFRIWPVFNIADSGITIGIFGFILYEVLSKKKH